MTEMAEELQEARKEFDLFGAYMKRPAALQQPLAEVPSQGSTTTGSGTPTQDHALNPDMEVDREKKHAAPSTGHQETPPKWAKGEAKGDKADHNIKEAFTGKGRAAETAPAPTLATNPQTAPKAAPSGATTANWAKQGTRNNPHQQGWRRQGGYQQWPARRRDREGGQDERSETREARELKELKEAVKAMGRLSLRMEDALGVIHLDMEYILFLQTEATGNEFAITQQLYDTAVEWNRMKQEQPTSLTNPMRKILLHNLFSALLMKLEALEEDQDLMAKARAKGLIEGSTYVYLQWDHSTRQHIKAAAQPLEYEEAVLSVKMTSESLGADIIPFSLVAQNRTQEVMDQGTLWPLTVTTPLIAMQPPDSQDTPTLNVPISLQKLIIQWRNQASRHAMLSEPNWLPVQVSRFDAQGRKVYAPVQVSAAVYIPSFVGDTLQTTPTRYQLAATIFHLGDSLLHGHYRTALYETGRIVSITDDNVRAQPASVADVNMVQQNSYIFILRKC
ncbi:unnamed protein product [Symbiodinium microadriaticum]|nr:unnamed protein product [Symbiodinium microadriaticum]CAE7881693.1 unnamed protein product [Symbiodinium sp. KB8]